jgi:hypothetical protein
VEFSWYLVSSLVLAALIALAGCSHYLLAERDSWRHEAESNCLNSGAVKETPERVRITAISGPGACGMDYPIRVSALGEGAPLGYDDEAVRPPGSIPNSALPQHWPVAAAAPSSAVQSSALPPPPQSAPRSTANPIRHRNLTRRHSPASRSRSPAGTAAAGR